MRAISGLSAKFLPWRIFVLVCIQSITSLTAMSSTTFTVRVETDVKKRLEKLAKSTGRSRSFLAAEALNQYLDGNEWQVTGVRKPWVPLIAGKAYPTSRSKHGSIPGAASANARPLDDWRNENRLVAGSCRRPSFAACLYCGRQSCYCPADRAAHHREHRAITARQSPNGPSGTGAGHPRTCHSEDTLHRALSAPANNDPNLARLSCGATLA